MEVYFTFLCEMLFLLIYACTNALGSQIIRQFGQTVCLALLCHSEVLQWLRMLKPCL